MFSESFTGEPPPAGSLLGKVLKVIWTDAKIWAHAWVAEDEIEGFYLPEVTSRGLVIRETASEIFLVQNESEDQYSNLT